MDMKGIKPQKKKIGITEKLSEMKKKEEKKELE